MPGIINGLQLGNRADDHFRRLISFLGSESGGYSMELWIVKNKQTQMTAYTSFFFVCVAWRENKGETTHASPGYNLLKTNDRTIEGRLF